METLQSPDQFFRLVVEENLKDYWNHRDDLRCAFNAAVSCLAMRDWMLASRPPYSDRTKRVERTKKANGNKGTRRATRVDRYTRWITRREPALAEVIDIANCAKHFRLDRGPSRGRSAKDIGWDHFRVGDPVGLTMQPLRVEKRDGKIVLFEDLLIAAVAYWRRTRRRSPTKTMQTG
jgi:hypothetical protein